MPDLLRLAACTGLLALPSAWPPCLRLCGLPPQSLVAAAPVGTFPPFVLALHLFMCDILEIRKLKDENSGAPPCLLAAHRAGATPCASWWGPSPALSPCP